MVKVDVLLAQQRHRLLAKAAPRHAGVALHKEHDLGTVHQLVAAALRILGGLVVDVHTRRKLVQQRILGLGRGAHAARRLVAAGSGLGGGIRLRQAVGTRSTGIRMRRKRIQHRRHIRATDLAEKRMAPQQNNGRNGLDVKGLSDVRLLLRLDIHKEDVGVPRCEINDRLIHLLARLRPRRPEVEQRHTLEILLHELRKHVGRRNRRHIRGGL